MTPTERIESLRPGSIAAYDKHIILGARYTAGPECILAVNWRKNDSADSYPYSSIPPTNRAGDLYFPVNVTIRL